MRMTPGAGASGIPGWSGIGGGDFGTLTHASQPLLSYAAPQYMPGIPAPEFPQNVNLNLAVGPGFSGFPGWRLPASGTSAPLHAQTFASMHACPGPLSPGPPLQADFLPFVHRARAHDVIHVSMHPAPDPLPARQSQREHGLQGDTDQATSAAHCGHGPNGDFDALDFTTTLGCDTAEPVLVFPRKGTSTEEGVIELGLGAIRWGAVSWLRAGGGDGVVLSCTDDVVAAVCRPLFRMRQADAAKKLGIAPSTLKHVCRKLGIARWPWRDQKHKRDRSVATSVAGAGATSSCASGAQGASVISSAASRPSQQVPLVSAAEEDCAGSAPHFPGLGECARQDQAISPQAGCCDAGSHTSERPADGVLPRVRPQTWQVMDSNSRGLLDEALDCI